jgi:alanyl-tRNA synthetase
MKSSELRKKYIEFFKARGHVEIPSAPLVPENDPTTLFTSSGMQPLIPYLLGQKHPLGKRLVNSQKSFRSQDIDEVGDTQHTTFFEMLGNWSLGDYFKKEQLPWIWEFLTKELNLPEEKLFVSVFEGTKGVPRDEESVRIWKSLGVHDAHIFYYGVKKNWWSRSGEPIKMPAGEPGGPDSEVFYDFGTPHNSKFVGKCHPNCQCGRFTEIANSVFMQYQKQVDGSLKELSQKNVDFGGGLERLVAVTEHTPDVFKTDLFVPILDQMAAVSQKEYAGNEVSMRILADHIKAAVMMIADGVTPSNKAQGYILRRLIRRALLHGRKLNNFSTIETLVPAIEKIYQTKYPGAAEILHEEALRFGKTLERGLFEIEKIKTMDGKIAFSLYETYGFPWEMTVEIAREKGQQVDRTQFEEEFKKHQDLSRTAAKGMFAGGLADRGQEITRLHTAHHILLAALQKVVDPTIRQRGSNITAQRLRMDFNFARKLTPEELGKIEKLVNEKIKADLPVTRAEMPREEAEKVGAQMEFGHKYPDRVSVYFVGSRDNFFSAEFCGGPHVTHTGELGRFKILKEESAGSGIRRIYATLSTP